MNDAIPGSDDLFTEISALIEQARQHVKQHVNTSMVRTYWQVGRLILEHEQHGTRRAAYGKQQLARLSQRLSQRFGRGFDITNLRSMRRFYEHYPIRDAVRLELSWTHYRTLMRVENPQAREWYTQEAIRQHWGCRALERQIGVLYYERLLSSKDKIAVESEAVKNTLPLAENPKDYLRDPYILDYFNLDDRLYQEKDLESGIINNLQRFFTGARQRVCFCRAATAYPHRRSRFLYRSCFLQLQT
ncbi:MAG: putative nuclease of restriction endonuclease-like (RecB) superfamily [Lentisphaeria bacterium]|jgi:predicted nuclease of restriction endonuclease-like (RecB) superfamily